MVAPRCSGVPFTQAGLLPTLQSGFSCSLSTTRSSLSQQEGGREGEGHITSASVQWCHTSYLAAGGLGMCL